MGAQHLGFPPISLVWPVTPRIVWPVALSITAIVGAIYLLTRVDNEDERLTLAVKEGVESTALKEIARSFSQEKHVAVEVIDLPYDEHGGAAATTATS